MVAIYIISICHGSTIALSPCEHGRSSLRLSLQAQRTWSRRLRCGIQVETDGLCFQLWVGEQSSCCSIAVALLCLQSIETYVDYLLSTRLQRTMLRREVEPLVGLCQGIVEYQVRTLVEYSRQNQLAWNYIHRREQTADIVLTGGLTTHYITRNIGQYVLHIGQGTFGDIILTELQLIKLI